MRKVLYILGQLHDDDIEWMTEAGYNENVAAKDTIIKAGLKSENLFIILSGSFEVLAGDSQIAVLQNGEILGEMSFVESAPPDVHVRAIEDSFVLRIPHQATHNRMDECPAFAARMYRAIAMFLSGRLRKTITSMGYGPDQLELDDYDPMEEDELDLELLDSLELAGERFQRIIKKLGEK